MDMLGISLKAQYKHAVWNHCAFLSLSRCSAWICNKWELKADSAETKWKTLGKCFFRRHSKHSEPACPFSTFRDICLAPDCSLLCIPSHSSECKDCTRQFWTSKQYKGKIVCFGFVHRILSLIKGKLQMLFVRFLSVQSFGYYSS